MTDDAFVREFQSRTGLKVDGDPGPATWAKLDELAPKQGAQFVWPASYAGMTAFYGPPGGPDCTAGRAVLPFAFPLAWDNSQRVSTISCHRKVAPALMGIFADAAAHYGEDEFRRLRLDRFGGCFNDRPMRGGTRKSVHAWGAAIDLDPTMNQLSWGADKASFGKPAYEPFWRIVEGYGATSLGRAKNYDWMHFQFAGL